MSKHNASTPLLIDEACLSKAWAKAFLHVIDHPGKEIAPLVISITGFQADRTVVEDEAVRREVDSALIALDQQDIESVAYTIFPERLWRMAKGDRKKLFDTYRMVFPRYKAMKKGLNKHGLYFERLTNFNSQTPCDGNQLEWILSNYINRPEVRRSMLQATTFDPTRDHVNLPRLGFPCLQQISFIPTDEGLVVNAFYATQLLLVKAYGNYLGLARLAAFMAHEMKMPLARLNVTVGVAKLDEVAKTSESLHSLIKISRLLISQSQAREMEQEQPVVGELLASAE